VKGSCFRLTLLQVSFMLSATAQHAIRALASLARVPADQSVLGRELAEAAQIPANFLAKVMLILGRAGIVDATRGQGGGYRLAQPPDRIPLMQVAELFDGINARPACFLGEKHDCHDMQACSAHSRWKVVSEAYLEFMTTTTIADLGAGNAPSRLHQVSNFDS
jgi:Rrf2 family transcriptional regulator, iron-sulfur cluster assembly transcription factor